MSQQSNQELKLTQLRQSLDKAIKSRTLLEEDFKAQSSILTAFIGRLSNLCKGLDLELDNRLAKLRIMLTTSALFTEIEQEINTISSLLNQQANKHEKSIRDMHDKFHFAGKSLQQIKGIPADVRRNLRELLNANPSYKDALIQYIPKLNELIDLYQQAFNGQKPTSRNATQPRIC